MLALPADGDSGLRTAAATQVRVIAALMLREMRTRFGQTQLGFVWALFVPLASVAVISAVFSIAGRQAVVGDSVPLFIATGMMTYTLFRRTASQCMGAFQANESLLRYPIVQRVDTVLARGLLEAATGVATMIILFVGLILVLDVARPHDVSNVLLSILLLNLLGFGYGTISAVLSTYFGSWKVIEGVISRPLFFTAGVFFSPQTLPPALLPLVTWNPILHGVELMRTGYFDGYRTPAADVTYLTLFALILVFIGLAAERATRFRPQQDD